MHIERGGHEQESLLHVSAGMLVLLACSCGSLCADKRRIFSDEDLQFKSISTLAVVQPCYGSKLLLIRCVVLKLFAEYLHERLRPSMLKDDGSTKQGL